MVGFAAATCGLTIVPPHICNMQNPDDSADTDSERLGQIQEKGRKTPNTELNIFLPKKISTENNNPTKLILAKDLMQIQ